ncbi:hypothetical protein CXF85_14180 [Colwellia sp. 75C3]|uniref:TorF family putative porin n=1 Tax=Colwellia sp. 75C3 TaxID=888425 RepID=UPI000C34DFE8|nr:TorF family putative porin [Colwellia sp. 75C3]PKG82060.1 hypothetical protein CXF85_14180 [Colwellia sp. 75C3]
MKYFFIIILFFSSSAWAATSSTVSGVSDYLFNGVSQTNEKPALQVSIDWAGDNGMYVGAWGSNVKFGEGTNLEADAYVGYYTALTSSINLDAGVAQYTYHGADISSDYNYAEAWTKFNYGNTNLNFWYAWDYFGTGAGHVIAMVTQTFPVSDNLSIIAGADISSSLDEDKWSWEANDKDYIHWRITAQYNLKGFDLSLGIEGTDLDTYGDTTLLLTVARTFNF